MDKYFARINKIPSVGSSTPRNVVANVDNSTPSPLIDNVEVVDGDDVEVVDGDDVEFDNGDDVVDGSEEAPSRPSVRDDADSQIQKKIRIDNLNILSDPALRKPLMEYEPSIRDVVRREYVTKGKNLNDAFVKSGFRNWRHGPERFRDHVGGAGGVHNEARILYFDFINQKQCVARWMSVASHSAQVHYRTRLSFSLDLTRQLLVRGQAFRGHDESEDSLNRGNFLSWHAWCRQRMPDLAKAMENAPMNLKLTSHRTQDDLVASCGALTRRAIVADIGVKFFSLLVDEARDNSIKEQMAIVVRYVNNHGEVMERFLGVVHVVDTKADSLKSAIDSFFAKYSLSISQLRGQGYDGASNMRGELGGLKRLILDENPYARYIHCFAHQLQLVVVAVCKGNRLVSDFFTFLTMIINMAGSSCKRKDQLRQKAHDEMVEKLERGEILSGRGLNQETSLARPGTTRWGSHYMTLTRLLHLWSSVIHVLYNVYDDGGDINGRGGAFGLIEKMNTYQFVFIAHLMQIVLRITNSLSQFLQKKDQNILEAVNLVRTCKRQIQQVRDNGWDDLVIDVNNFCERNKIVIVNMEDDVVGQFHCRRPPITYYHHFRVDIFCEVIDKLSQEMENRFSETNTELLTCIGCLDPRNSFSNFSISKALQVAKLYPRDFTELELIQLQDQLDTWIVHMREGNNFSGLEDIGDITKQMVKVGIHSVFPLVYRLLELVLVLPVATASVERVFSAMNIVKSDLRNKMSDDHLSDNLVCYVEKDIFSSIDNEPILEHYQAMRTRRVDLLPSS